MTRTVRAAALHHHVDRFATPSEEKLLVDVKSPGRPLCSYGARLANSVTSVRQIAEHRLVRRRLLDVIDHENINSGLRRLQLQPELLLKRRKEQRAGVRRLICCPCQINVIDPLQLRVIDDDLLHRRSQGVGQLRHQVRAGRRALRAHAARHTAGKGARVRLDERPRIERRSPHMTAEDRDPTRRAVSPRPRHTRSVVSAPGGRRTEIGRPAAVALSGGSHPACRALEPPLRRPGSSRRCWTARRRSTPHRACRRPGPRCRITADMLVTPK